MKIGFRSIYRVKLNERELDNQKYGMFVDDTISLRAKNSVATFNPKLMLHYMNIRDSKDTLFEKIADIYGYNIEQTCPQMMLGEKVVGVTKMKGRYEVDLMKALKNKS